MREERDRGKQGQRKGRKRAEGGRSGHSKGTEGYKMDTSEKARAASSTRPRTYS